MSISRSIASPIARPLASPLAGGVLGLLDFLPPALRTGGLALGTSRLFGSYSGPLIRLRRGSDSVEQDVGSGTARVSSDAVITHVGKNLLLNTATLSTQSVTSIAANYTLSFTGTGTVTLSGTSTAGPLVGTGGSNRVSLAFTPPTAGTLTLTVSGSVTDAQLQFGSSFDGYEVRGGTAAERCLVTKLYGQLGAFEAVQADPVKMPQLVPRQIGEWPIMVGDGVDDALTISGVLVPLNGKDITYITAGKKAYSGTTIIPRLTQSRTFASYQASGNLTYGATSDTVWRVLTLRSEVNAQLMRVDGVQTATAAETRITTFFASPFQLGRTESSYANPPQAILLLPTALAIASIASIESVLMSEYSN